MTYEIIISPTAQRQLEKLEKSIQNRILASLERMRIRPYSFIQKLSGYSFFRMRVGDYRIMLDIHDNELEILVVKIGHRKNIYKL